MSRTIRLITAVDLHLGDVHLTRVPDIDANDITSSSKRDEDANKIWVALCVVESYDGRRKIPQSDLSLPHFQTCLQKVATAAGKHSESIHMPRIHVGAGGKQRRKGWYVVERLLRKDATASHFHVYYFQRRGAVQD